MVIQGNEYQFCVHSSHYLKAEYNIFILIKTIVKSPGSNSIF